MHWLAYAVPSKRRGRRKVSPFLISFNAATGMRGAEACTTCVIGQSVYPQLLLLCYSRIVVATGTDVNVVEDEKKERERGATTT